MKGNWFELRNKVSSQLVEMSREEFIDYVTEQVSSCKHLLQDIKSYYRNMSVKSIDYRLTDQVWEKLIALNENEVRHPIITFHGTSAEAREAILNEGYKAPGINGGKRSHGAMYGPGVYTSHFLHKASTYGEKTLLVNIVFLGKAKLIAPYSGAVKAPVNGVYPDGVNTRIVFGLDQVVSGDPERVVPIGLVTIH